MIAETTRDAAGDLFEADSIVAQRYRVVSYRGDRGFGQVYEAHDSAMDRKVALMRLSREFSRPDTRESFYETRSTAAVEDPRIVDLSDYGEDVDGRLFLVMPWVEEAEALDELLAREGSIGWLRVKAIVLQIAGALEAAHAKGVLHGGLEPRRVLIDRNDGVHIVDFGLAPALTQTTAREVTLSGPLPGKIEYLSPEQVRGEAVDERSDIYALGVILWELIAGAPPFTGDSVVVADAHLGAPLPELPRRGPTPSTPAEIEPLLHLALTKDPGERLSSATEFASLLAAMPDLPVQPVVARVPTKPLVRPAKAKVVPRPPKLAPPPIKPAALKPSPETTAPRLVHPAVAPAAIADPSPAARELPSTPSAPPPAPSVVVADALPHAVIAEPDPPRPASRRRLGKLELAILIFLAFDVLLFATWKLFASDDDSGEVAAAGQEPSPSPEPETPSAEPTEPTEPNQPSAELDEHEPAPAPDTEPQPSVEELIAAELPPEPDTPGPVRPMARSLSDKTFREAMVAARDTTLQTCMDSRMRRTLKVALKVAPSGKVEYARVVGSQGKTSLGQCIAKQVYKIEFPATHEGGSHTYTLRLR